MPKPTVITPGTQYGHLTVISEGDREGTQKRRTAVCTCSCGSTVTVRLSSLTSGHATTCGCGRVEGATQALVARNTTHGKKHTRAYSIWCAMKRRCHNPKEPGYADYGGRGITVCERWKDSFENFYADMGDPPSDDHSLDRKKVDGNYDLDNCRWATRLEQNNNRRDTIFLTHDGVSRSIGDWSRLLGINKRTLEWRYYQGKSVDAILKQPLR